MELIITEKPPSVCLNMIVKNESHIIIETLEMLCKKIQFSHWVICDTGSTDNTRELITTFFKDKNIPGELHTHEWKNFAHNRTLALNEAYEKTDLLFVFDADDELHGDFNIPSTVDADGYYLHFGDSRGISYSRILLVNNRIRWEYQSVIHEYINCLKPNPVLKHIDSKYYVVSGRRGSRSQDPNKYLKDAKVLEEAHAIALKENDKLYLRYAFYCANSYRDAGKYREAIKWYNITLGQENWEQEKYNCCLSMYNCYKELSENVNGFFYLVESLKYDTERIECMYELIYHYLINNMYTVAYNYYRNSKNFYETKFLKEKLLDKLFIENDKYELLFPFNMILVADKVKDEYPEANITIAKMYEIIFTKKYIFGIAEFYIGNTLYNLQFFIDICIKEIPDFLVLFQDYINFLHKNSVSLNKYYNFLCLFEKYNIKYKNTPDNIITIENSIACKNSNKILFYTGYSSDEWNYSYSLTNALGGSETAVAYLSKIFPNSYDIYVGGTVKEENIDNVYYINFNTMHNMIKNTSFHTVIVSRYLGFYEIFNTASFYQSYIWGHDVELNAYGSNIDVDELLNKWSNKINGCICQTEWHANLFKQKYKSLQNKIHIINNGITPELFKYTPIKKQNSFLYSSCSERGLNKVLQLWPTILEKMPDAELLISSYNHFPNNENESEKEMKKIIDKYSSSVKHVGRLNRDHLYELMSITEYWLYPTNWPETSCITALEMLASEVICLYYPIAGLIDTMGNYGKQISEGNEIDTLLNLTNGEKCKLKKQGKEYALSCSWNNRYKLWSEVLFKKKFWIFYFNEDFEIKLIIEYLLNLNSDTLVVEVTNDKQYILQKQPDRLTIVSFIFDKNIFNELSNCEFGLLNTEPLNLQCRLDSFMQDCNRIPLYKIYDYSDSNIKILHKNGITNPTEKISYNFNKNEIYILKDLYNTTTKIYDFGFLYNWKEKGNKTQGLPITPPRRNNVLEWLINNGFSINIIAGFDKERDIELAKCKYILNIHGQINENPNPTPEECSNIFEHIRCDRLLESGYQIISETSYELDENYIKKYPNLKLINYNEFFNLNTYINLFTHKPK